jgi:hypothetical protein
MTAGHGVMREGAAIRGRAGSTSVVMSGVLTRIGILVRRDVASEAQGAMTAAPVLEAVSVMTAGAATAPTEDLVLRELLSVGRSGIGTIVEAPPVASAVHSETVMIVGRVVRVARVGLRSGRGTIVGAPPVVSAVRSGMTVVPGEKADIRAMTVRGRSHGIRVMSVPTVARVRGTAGTTVRRTPRRASRCPSSSRTSRLMSSTRKCVRSSVPCPTTWRSWSAGT